MRKNVLRAIACMGCMMMSTGTVYADDTVNENVQTQENETENTAGTSSGDTGTSYQTVPAYVARDGAEVYAGTGEGQEPVRYIAENTEIAKVWDQDGWTCFVHDSGLQYIKTEDTKESITPPRTWTDDDLYIMAHVICGEAQDCDDQEQQFVASVVMNRVASGKYPNSIHDVVFQRGQYACTRDGNYYRMPTARNWANAQYILEHGSVLPEGVLGQSGSKQGPVYVRTKHHYYCYM